MRTTMRNARGRDVEIVPVTSDLLWDMADRIGSRVQAIGGAPRLRGGQVA